MVVDYRFAILELGHGLKLFPTHRLEEVLGLFEFESATLGFLHALGDLTNGHDLFDRSGEIADHDVAGSHLLEVFELLPLVSLVVIGCVILCASDGQILEIPNPRTGV